MHSCSAWTPRHGPGVCMRGQDCKESTDMEGVRVAAVEQRWSTLVYSDSKCGCTKRDLHRSIQSSSQERERQARRKAGERKKSEWIWIPTGGLKFCLKLSFSPPFFRLILSPPTRLRKSAICMDSSWLRGVTFRSSRRLLRASGTVCCGTHVTWT